MATTHVPLPDDVRWSLKSAVRDLVRRVGGARRAEQVIGVSDSQILRCMDPDDPSMLSIAAVIHLEEETGKPLVTAFLASLSGNRLALSGDGPPKNSTSVPAAFAGAVSEASDLLTTTADALADGSVSERESRDIAAAATDATDAIGALARSVASADLRLVPRRT